jgi:hypothetical protein
VPDTPQIDYLCHAYRQQLPVWELLDAVYHGDRAWLDYKADGTISPKANAKRFLPQLPGESNSEYHQRPHIGLGVTQALAVTNPDQHVGGGGGG